jgi:hypothetical protein
MVAPASASRSLAQYAVSGLRSKTTFQVRHQVRSRPHRWGRRFRGDLRASARRNALHRA